MRTATAFTPTRVEVIEPIASFKACATEKTAQFVSIKTFISLIRTTSPTDGEILLCLE